MKSQTFWFLRPEYLQLPFFDDLWKVLIEITKRKVLEDQLKKRLNADSGKELVSKGNESELCEQRASNVKNSLRTIVKWKEEKLTTDCVQMITTNETKTKLSNLFTVNPLNSSKSQRYQVSMDSLLQSNPSPDSHAPSILDSSNLSRLSHKSIVKIISDENAVFISHIQADNLDELVEEIYVPKLECAVPRSDPILQELLQICLDDPNSFTIISQAPRVQVFNHRLEKPTVLVKSHFEINLSASRVFELIYNLDYRSQWDRNFSKFKIVKVIDQSTDLVYCYFKAPLFVTDRDYLQKRVVARDFAGADFIIGFRSIEDFDCPTIKGVIRAHTYISGYVITAVDSRKCRLTSVSQTDFKGYIPPVIMKQAVQKGPLEWLENIEAASSMMIDSY